MPDSYEIYSIGIISKEEDHSKIILRDRYRKAVLGLDGFSHIQVLYWLHKNDDPDQRRTLQVYPRGKRSNPLSGVFATRTPVRPNPIAVSICKVLSIEESTEETTILVDRIDAFDGSPVIDIKCHIPRDIDPSEIRLPGWV